MVESAVTIRDLTKIYKNNFLALKGVSLDVKRGDFFGLLGPNGAGKTTLIGILTTLVTKTAGTVKIFDKDIETDPEGAKSMMGLVPQEVNFNVFERVDQILIQQAGFYGVPRHRAKRRAEQTLEQLGLIEKRRNRVLELSGGMKRRLMIARALVHEPMLLILDEPTAGVDLEIRHSLWQLMEEVNASGVTIILTTHYLEEAESLCRQIAIIDKGEIIENTDINELLNKQQSECYIVTFDQPVDALQLNDFRCWRLNNYDYEIEVRQHQNLTELFQCFNQKNLRIKRINRRKTRLEELFLQLTAP